MHGGSDKCSIGFVALGDDVTERASGEGTVNTRCTHDRNVVVVEILRDKALRPGLARSYADPELHPDVADVVVCLLFESHAGNVDGDLLQAETLFETLPDNCLVARNVRPIVFRIIVNGEGGGDEPYIRST